MFCAFMLSLVKFLISLRYIPLVQSRLFTKPKYSGLKHRESLPVEMSFHLSQLLHHIIYEI